MDDPAVFTNFVKKILRVTNQKTNGVITNFGESFGYLLDNNDGDIDTFVVDVHYTNNARAAEQRILISNNVTQGLKSMFF